jgi:UPF0176 protein
MAEKTKILLYYKYVSLPDVGRIRLEQKLLCQRLELKGRLLLSDEGINGTLAGSPENIDAYMQETMKIPEFADLEWKISWADEQVFPKLRVVIRDEIVTLGIRKTGQDVSISNKADYIQPSELRALYESGEDFIIVDARNEYEARIGKFAGAVVPPIRNFREFPAFVQSELADFKDKTIVTYCTGGVRCEKASAYMREQGFQNVRQLHGGIHEYGEQAGGKFFEGEMFVFDKRLHIPVNTENPVVIAHCVYCEVPITRYIDCAERRCGGLIVCCASCEETHLGACSLECENLIRSYSS